MPVFLFIHNWYDYFIYILQEGEERVSVPGRRRREEADMMNHGSAYTKKKR